MTEDERNSKRNRTTPDRHRRRMPMAFAALTAAFMLFAAACGSSSEQTIAADAEDAALSSVYETAEETAESTEYEESAETESAQEKKESAEEEETESTADALESGDAGEFRLKDVPVYSGTPYVVINGNVPYFTAEDLTTESYETYSDLDLLGRCGVAESCIGQDLMPTEARGSIGSVKPTGWHTVKYDIVSGKYLYNRCHLIAYELSGENANEKNLITGTRYFNVEGMLPFENMVADYVKETGNHVLYRVTPVFSGDNLVADGVLMEARSVEDGGEDIEFCVFCYNVQPGITIDYATGDSYEDGTVTAETADVSAAAPETAQADEETVTSGGGSGGDSYAEDVTYILNTNSMKFHLPDCSSVGQMSEKNKKEFTGTREEAIAMGYSPCKSCNP